MTTTSPTPEILAPVATWEMLRAAVHNGTDAIYMGMPHFNARGRSPDYSAEELGKMIAFAHLYGVRVFLATNVLIFERELAQIESLLREILPHHPDALIVQDLGLVWLIKKLAPEQVVHASTQMTVTDARAITLTEDLDIARYVLGRELSIEEMKKVRSETTKELEVFVHGALCVSYSGQCLTSESQGGRSANRGQCAQSCRLPYKLVVDGEVRELGEKHYLVSPQDLAGLADVPRLIEAGINSFKIEGRYKSPEYVASTVKNYREACDAALSKENLSDLDTRFNELGITFARGRFNGWYDGVNHQKLVDARFSKARGNYLGEILAIQNGTLELHGSIVLHAGDGVAFHDFDNNLEYGAPVYEVRSTPRGTQLLYFGRDFSLEKLTVGMQVFHTSSPSLDKALRKSFEDRALNRKIPVTIKVQGKIGEPLVVEYRDNDQNKVQVQTTTVLAPARKAPLTAHAASAELGALAATPFVLNAVEFNVIGECFIHTRELKELRRHAVELLTTKRSERAPCTFTTHEELESSKQTLISSIQVHPRHSAPTLSVLLRDESQLEAVRGLDIGMVYLDFEFNKEYEGALHALREMKIPCSIATTRILKPGEYGHLKYIARLKPDGILVRNLGALSYFQESEIPLYGDFSLNVANSITAAYLRQKRLTTLTPSYDLNQPQLLDLIEAGNGAQFEITVHQYMPAFHMEHCVFAAFLSNGKSFRDCGKPCEKHRVELVDPNGTHHPLKADAECRNTMFQGKPQSAARLIPELRRRGVNRFRLEALFETPDKLREKILAYIAVLHDEAPSENIFERLGITERYGVTEGQLFNERLYADRKKYDSLTVL